MNVRVLHNWRDPLFGGGLPEPKPEQLGELMQVVRNEKLDLGIATDGDADRFAVVDELGNYFSPNQLLCLLTRHLVKNRGQKGAIVRTVATTHLLDRLSRLYGLALIETPVGFKYVGEKMRDGNVLIGGEESGGVSIEGHIPEKDGILANLLLIEMLAIEGRPLSQIWSDLVKETGTALVYRRFDMHLASCTQVALMEQLARNPFKTLGGAPVARVSQLDGLKFYIDDENWLLIRPSGTEPLLRVYAEGFPDHRVDNAMIDLNIQLEQLLSNLNHKTTIPDNTAVQPASRY